MKGVILCLVLLLSLVFCGCTVENEYSITTHVVREQPKMCLFTGYFVDGNDLVHTSYGYCPCGQRGEFVSEGKLICHPI